MCSVSGELIQLKKLRYKGMDTPHFYNNMLNNAFHNSSLVTHTINILYDHNSLFHSTPVLPYHRLIWGNVGL